MLDNTYNEDNVMGQQFAEGTPVYDMNGTKVGAVSEQGVRGDNLVLQKGLFFPHDYFVPLQAITHADADGIHLNVMKDDVTNQDFSNRTPADTTSAGSTDRDTLGTTDIASSDQQTESAIGRHDTPVRGGDMRVPVREEELNIDTQQTEDGRAHIHTDVAEEQQVVNVPTAHEELRVERVPVAGDATAVGPDAFMGRDIDIPLRGEEVVAHKEARVAEEIHLHKQQVTENQRVGDTVRKERVRIEGEGIAEGQGNNAQYGRDDLGYAEDIDDAQSRRGI